MDRIITDPGIQHGKPVIRGTRVPVARILGSLASGMSLDDVQREYGVDRQDIQAAVEFASLLIEREEHHALPR